MSNENKPKPHPYAHWIKLWADGVPIEYKACGKWIKVIDFTLTTQPDIEYRIKPETEKRWKPKAGELFWVVNAMGEVEPVRWVDGTKFCDYAHLFGNCFQTKEEAEAAIPRVEDALKGELKISAPNAENFQLDDKPLTNGEKALIRALRNGNIYQVYEGDSLLVFNDEDDGLQVDGDAIAFDSAEWNDEIRACLKKIQKEQELVK